MFPQKRSLIEETGSFTNRKRKITENARKKPKNVTKLPDASGKNGNQLSTGIFTLSSISNILKLHNLQRFNPLIVIKNSPSIFSFHYRNSPKKRYHKLSNNHHLHI